MGSTCTHSLTHFCIAELLVQLSHSKLLLLLLKRHKILEPHLARHHRGNCYPECLHLEILISQEETLQLIVALYNYSISWVNTYHSIFIAKIYLSEVWSPSHQTIKENQQNKATTALMVPSITKACPGKK